MKRRILWAAATGIVGATVVSSTPPLPPPWHEYRVSGVVKSASGTNANHAVALAGRWPMTGEMRLLPYYGSPVVALTDTAGAFRLVVRDLAVSGLAVSGLGGEDVDTIFVVVVHPDTMYTSDPIGVAADAWRKQVHLQRVGAGACDEGRLVEVVDGFLFVAPPDTVDIP